jgi:hypothetical protein
MSKPVVIYTKGGHPVWPPGPRPKIGGEAIVRWMLATVIREHPDTPEMSLQSPFGLNQPTKERKEEECYRPI